MRRPMPKPAMTDDELRARIHTRRLQLSTASDGRREGHTWEMQTAVAATVLAELLLDLMEAELDG